MKKFLSRAAIIFALAGVYDTSQAHLLPNTLACPVFDRIIPKHTPKLLRTETEVQGFVTEVYDITGDGIADIATYSPSIGGIDPDGTPSHKDAATFYELDNNGDGEPDILYIDKYGEKKCDDIVFYHHITGNYGNPGGLMRGN